MLTGTPAANTKWIKPQQWHKAIYMYVLVQNFA